MWMDELAVSIAGVFWNRNRKAEKPENKN